MIRDSFGMRFDKWVSAKLGIPSMTDDSPNMRFTEWAAVLIYLGTIGFIFLCTAVSHWTGVSYGPDPVICHLVDPLIDVYVAGEVQNPGPYRVPRAMTRGELLSMALPLDSANLARMKTTCVLKQGELLEVPRKEYVYCRVEGEVEEVLDVTLEKGARVCDLKKLIVLTEQADARFLNRKRRLKDGEVLVIPALKAKKRPSR